MANIARSKRENDFALVVGNTRCDCRWFVADFLSPRVAHLHANDPSVFEIVISISDPQGQFGNFVSLGLGNEIRLTSGNRSFLLSIADTLANYEIYFEICDYIDNEMSIAQFCTNFGYLYGIGSGPDHVIAFISSHFFKINQSFLIPDS
jgi:hypothetical protein